MVGSWTRRVPDKMKSQRLYGPCGPMPPCTDEHTWVQEISKGYPKSGGKKSKKSNKAAPTKTIVDDANFKVVPIPKITPTWEAFRSTASQDEPPLMIPRGIDHRFFVHSGSMCFRESLFERDEFDEMDDEEEEEENAEDEDQEE